MSATVSLIDPTTLNPSFSGPENSRLLRPPVFITRTDQQTSVDQLELLLSEAKAYRLQMLALSKAAANFGYALEKVAHSKAAVRDPSNVSASLQAAAGLHYLISNHHQVLGDIVYKQFVIPLLQQLDTYKVNMEASEAQYERSMREMSQKIKETEAASMENGRKRQRDLYQFRQFLSTLAMQVDELEHMKLGYYFSNLEAEQAHLQLILQKTSTIVRAEVDIYERIANKGQDDPLLEPMTTQGPDPYCTHPTTAELPTIISILPSVPIIPTSGTETSTLLHDVMTTDLHFSTSRKLTNITSRDRLLFGDTSSMASKESIVTTTIVSGSKIDSARRSSDENIPLRDSTIRIAGQPGNIQDRTVAGPDESSPLQEAREPEDAANVQQPSRSLHSATEHQKSFGISTSSGNAVSNTSLSDERESPARSLHESRSGSLTNLAFASALESPSVRSTIYIPRDSELLNNKEFSFSYEPSELLEQQTHHTQLDFGRHDAQPFESFEEDGGFGASFTGLYRSASSSHLQQQHIRDDSHHLQGLQHHASDEQLSHSAHSRSDRDITTAFMDTSLEEPFNSSVAKHTDLRGSFSDGMPAFYADEADDPQARELAQTRQHSPGFRSSQGSRSHSRCEDQDLMQEPFLGSDASTESIRTGGSVKSMSVAYS
ncbi:MAG: hypothetical protein J3Q66DRAFT_330299 [Benniella sp.]|nr:MAG: hypothetical protein J3Q66DRAFT_330299 [Benniella sp.]